MTVMHRLPDGSTGFNVPLAVAACLLGALAFFVLLRSKRQAGQLSLPPGPPQDPVLGNEKQRPKSHPWRTYAAWRERYGEQVKATQQTVVVLTPLY